MAICYYLFIDFVSLVVDTGERERERESKDWEGSWHGNVTYLVLGSSVILRDHVLRQVDADALRDVGSEGLHIR